MLILKNLLNTVSNNAMQFFVAKTQRAMGLFLISVLHTFSVNAATADNKTRLSYNPKWSLELKAGRFEPDIDNWETFYGQDYTHSFGAAFAYKLLDQIEIGLEGSWIRDKGQGFLVNNNMLGGNVKYQLFPLNVYILFRGVYTRNQWIVPYVGGGWSRAYYRANIQNQSSIDGNENGTHYRVGLQFLLNNVSKKGTRNLKRSFGIVNTYFFIEVQELTAEVESLNLDLGGKSTMMGVLFEY